MKKCLFCDGERAEIYTLNGYHSAQCKNCLTVGVEEEISPEELSKFYSGFAFSSSLRKKKLVIKPAIKQWLESLNLPQNPKMLDIGGGGGFFSYAFEHFCFGESFYIDLDDTACDFAKNSLNLKNVINDDVKNIKNYYEDGFDFIYCRHVIEHLINPVELIDTAIDLLSENGVFVLQFPNGISYENIGYPERIKNYGKKRRKSNNWSLLKTIKSVCSPQIAHGLDPLRHLWAISEKGVREYLKHRNDIEIQVKTAPLSDEVYSPYHLIKTPLSKFRTFIVNNTFAKINGGMHLVFFIRKK